MKKHYDLAKEELAYYEANGTSLQNMLAVLIGPSANPKVTGHLSSMGVENLISMSAQELIKLDGIGEATAQRIMSAITLSKFINSYKKDKVEKIVHPQNVYDVCSDLRFETSEKFEALFLSTKNNIIARKTIFQGSLNTCVVHPREIFKEAIRLSAAAMVCVHNHPSGCTDPSENDIEVTERLLETGRVIGIDVLDHVIIAGQTYYSMKEKGHM